MPRQRTKRKKKTAASDLTEPMALADGTVEDEASSAPKRTARRGRRKSKSASKRFRRIKIGAIALVLLFAAMAYCLDIDTVSANAMQPALHKGDVVLSFAPVFPKCRVQPGDVVRLRRGEDDAASPNFLRVMALGPAQIGYKDDALDIDGHAPSRLELTNPAISRPGGAPDIWRETLKNGAAYRIMLPHVPIEGALEGTVQLTENQAFLAGDNRMASYDSRQIGPVALSDLTGCALFIIRSDSDDGIVGHWIKPLR